MYIIIMFTTIIIFQRMLRRLSRRRRAWYRKVMSCLHHYFNTRPATTMRNITHATLQSFCTLHTLRSPSDSTMLKIQQYQCKTHGFHTSRALDPTFGKPSSSHSISAPTNINAQFLLQSCVCVCVYVFPYNALCKLFWLDCPLCMYRILYLG